MRAASPLSPLWERLRGPSPIVRELPAGARGQDAVLAAALFVATMLSAGLSIVSGLYGDEAADAVWILPYALAVTAPLALRRRFPGTVVLIVAVAFFLAGTFRIPELYLGNIALFIALYTVGAWMSDRRRALLVRVLITLGMFVWLLVTMYQGATAPTDEGLSRAGLFSPYVAFMLMQLLVNVAFFGGAFFMGDRAFTAARERDALTERTAELERERAVTAAQAVALDRVRIARELHDVVAHHVSAMGVQAGAARAVLERSPDRAAQTLIGIETSAREAIADLRLLLQTLRGEDADPDASTLSLADLDALVAHARENGLPTEFTVIGDPVPLPDVTAVNIFRVAQEALTNARRHAGAHAAADVRLRYGDEEIELEVTNTGSVPMAPRAGLGLIGMRERAAASGGRIEIGPRPRGGFLVRLTVPREVAA